MPSGPDRSRLDIAMVERSLCRSRAQAQDLIGRGLVRVGDVQAERASMRVGSADDIRIDETAPRFASRGGHKLAAALDRFAIDPSDRTVVDLGASTGGFTDVLLRRGAARVFAIDVGRGQLDPALAADPRVAVLDGINVRHLTAAMLPGPFDMLTADLSFISLRLALPRALALAAHGATAIVLVKPQFEVGRGGLGKGGIVRDPQARADALARVAAWFGAEPGWRVIGSIDSPIAGGDGNAEALLAARKDRG